MVNGGLIESYKKKKSYFLLYILIGKYIIFLFYSIEITIFIKFREEIV